MGFRSAMFCWGWPWSQGAPRPGHAGEQDRTVDSGHCGDSGHSGRPAASRQQVWDDGRNSARCAIDTSRYENHTPGDPRPRQGTKQASRTLQVSNWPGREPCAGSG